MDLDAIRTDSTMPLDWVNILFLVITPFIALFGTAWYVAHNGVTWLEVFNFFLMFYLTGLAITGGYHRYYSHKTYECNRVLQFLYLVFGAAAVQNSVLNWASDHRYHHRYVDREEDPYNILRGGLWAHIGWIFHKDTRQMHQRFKNVPDLLKDPLVLWQDKYYLPILVIATFALPTYIGLLGGRPMGGLLWGGFLRIVIVHHMTFAINSVAHMVGSRPYTEQNSARDNWMLGPFTFGEGYHNFHHKFQADYRNGVRWYQFDCAKWMLRVFEHCGWAWGLKRTPEALIVKAKMEVQRLRVEKKLQRADAPRRMWELVQARLASGQRRLDLAMSQYSQARVEYRHRKDEWTAEARRQFKAKLAEYKTELEHAQERWADMIRAMNRIPRPAAQSLFTITALLDVFKYKL